MQKPTIFELLERVNAGLMRAIPAGADATDEELEDLAPSPDDEGPENGGPDNLAANEQEKAFQRGFERVRGKVNTKPVDTGYREKLPKAMGGVRG